MSSGTSVDRAPSTRSTRKTLGAEAPIAGDRAATRRDGRPVVGRTDAVAPFRGHGLQTARQAQGQALPQVAAAAISRLTRSSRASSGALVVGGTSRATIVEQARQPPRGRSGRTVALQRSHRTAAVSASHGLGRERDRLPRAPPGRQARTASASAHLGRSSCNPARGAADSRARRAADYISPERTAKRPRRGRRDASGLKRRDKRG